MLYEFNWGSAWRLEIFTGDTSVIFGKSGKGGKMTALPEIMVTVFIDMGEEYIGITLCVLTLTSDGTFAVLDGIKTKSSCSHQNVTTMVLYQGVDTWFPTVGKRKACKVVGLVVVAHQSLGASDPQVTFLVDEKS